MKEYWFEIFDATFKDDPWELGKQLLWHEREVHHQNGGTSEEWMAEHVIRNVIVHSDNFDNGRAEAISLFEEEFDRKVSHVRFISEQEI